MTKRNSLRRPRSWSAPEPPEKKCILDGGSLETHQELECSYEQQTTPDTPNTSVDSAYFSSPGGASPEVIFSGSGTWVASLRSFLQRQRAVPQRRAAISVSLIGCSSLPETHEELDQFLTEVWEGVSIGKEGSKYARKISELKAFYHSKMSEVSQREATYTSELMYCDDTTPLLTADELASSPDGGMKQVLLETKVGYKFDSLRFKLKQEVAQTVLHLRAHFVDTGRKRRNLRPKATKLLSSWFEENVDHPYPSESDKRRLALQCDITMDQVTTWFSNKRHRSKKPYLKKKNKLN